MRALAAFVAAWALGASAFAQAPSEDGLGPYRFGMSMDAVRATAPNAEWRQERINDQDTLTSGRLARIGNGRFSTLLVFQENQLARILLLATNPRSCADATPTVVEDLEPAYGAFRSAPAIGEIGALASLRRTAMGSEIRLRDNTEGQQASVFATQRRAGMFIIVSGAQDAHEPTECRVSIAFDRALTQPTPEARELFDRIEHAETSMVTNWRRRPDGENFARVYPSRALDAGLDGAAWLDCIILENGALDCLIASETPVGSGFGNAAGQLGQFFRVEVRGDNAAQIGKRVRVPVRFEVW